MKKLPSMKMKYKVDLFWQLLSTSFQLRYRNSILGIVWALFKPLVMSIVLYFVFSFFGSKYVVNFPMYLLVGVMIYNFVSEGVLAGMRSLLDKANVIIKVNFPRQISVIATVGLAIVNFLINLLIVGIFSFFVEISPTFFSILYFFAVIIVLILLIVGFSFFSSILLVVVRDLEHVSQLALQILFYGTPIFYTLDFVSPTVAGIIKFNPLFYIIAAARDALISGKIEYIKEIGIISIIALGILFTGQVYFKKNIKRIAEYF